MCLFLAAELTESDAHRLVYPVIHSEPRPQRVTLAPPFGLVCHINEHTVCPQECISGCGTDLHL